MPIPRKEIPSLVTLATQVVVDITEKWLKPFLPSMPMSPDESRPSVSPFNKLDDDCSKLIIEMLIKKETLKYRHLNFILSNDITEMSCDESSFFSPFSLNMLEIISKRCKKFSTVHYHSSVGAPPYSLYIESLLHEVLFRMSANVTEINFTDTVVNDKTMQVICSNFISLRKLNFHKAHVYTPSFNNLIMPCCAFKTGLTELIVDGTDVSFAMVSNFLFHFENLLRFVSDETIRSFSYMKVKRIIYVKREDGRSRYFKTSVLKQNFATFKFVLTEMQAIRGAERLHYHFPLVNHLIMTSLTSFSIPLVNKIISTFWVAKLELSGLSEGYLFSDIKPGLDERVSRNLKELSLEKFYLVDLLYLGRFFKVLEKLILVNNTYKFEEIRTWEKGFSNLKEFQFILIRSQLPECRRVSDYYINQNSFYYILSSTLLERVLIVDQIDFGDVLESVLDSGHLQNLRDLSCFGCPIRDNILLNLFEKGMPIQRIEISEYYASENSLKKIIEIIKENNYATSVYITRGLPYRLRSSLVNIHYFSKNSQMLHDI